MRLITILLATLTIATTAYAHNAAVTNAYARPTLDGVTTGVAYLTLTSPHDDALTGVTTDAAGKAELHDHLMEDGIMRMRQVKEVALKGGTPARMGSGGLHIMMFDMKRALKAGDTLTLTLHFALSPDVTVTVPVQEDAPEAEAAPAEHHSHH